MRILHIWNVAGVASIIAKYMDRLFGTKSLVVHRAAFDPYGLTTYGELWNCGAEMFVLKCLLLARKFDIIYVHDLDKIIPLLKHFYHKPIIIHYHGTKIRNKWHERKKFWSRADRVLVSTPDLIKGAPSGVIYLPNPVDTDLFHPLSCSRKPKSALAFRYLLDERKAIYWAQKYGLQLTFLERKIPYKEMPKLLNQYEYYIDRTEIPSLSKTALEALACGLKVIRWDGKVIENLPEEHYPEIVTKKAFDICSDLYKA